MVGEQLTHHGLTYSSIFLGARRDVPAVFILKNEFPEKGMAHRGQKLPSVSGLPNILDLLPPQSLVDTEARPSCFSEPIVRSRAERLPVEFCLLYDPPMTAGRRYSSLAVSAVSYGATTSEPLKKKNCPPRALCRHLHRY